jgi:hypothetical protein
MLPVPAGQLRKSAHYQTDGRVTGRGKVTRSSQPAAWPGNDAAQRRRVPSSATWLNLLHRRSYSLSMKGRGTGTRNSRSTRTHVPPGIADNVLRVVTGWRPLIIPRDRVRVGGSNSTATVTNSILPFGSSTSMRPNQPPFGSRQLSRMVVGSGFSAASWPD